MDLVSHAIVTLADTRSYLGYTNTAKDESIKLFINISTDMIETYTGRRFASTVYTQEPFDGNGEKEILLPQYPVTAFSILEKNGAADNSSSWETVDSASYWRKDDEGILIGTARFSCGVRNYRATFTAGYTAGNIPYDLQFACMKMVELMFRDQKASGLESERLGDHSVVFAKASEQDPTLQKVLDKYKKPNL